jgi:hypothetical protein
MTAVHSDPPLAAIDFRCLSTLNAPMGAALRPQAPASDHPHKVSERRYHRSLTFSPRRRYINVLGWILSLLKGRDPIRSPGHDVLTLLRRNPMKGESVVTSEREGRVEVPCFFWVMSRRIDLFQDLLVHPWLYPRPPPIYPNSGSGNCTPSCYEIGCLIVHLQARKYGHLDLGCRRFYANRGRSATPNER